MVVISFKCPNCDGELIFDPESQQYKCEYCNSLFSQEELDAMKPAAAGEVQAEEPGNGAQAEEIETGTKDAHQAMEYTCPSCGAQIITDQTTAATFCYYCHNPVVLGGKLAGEFLPDKIIPFEITREEAIKGFLGYTGKRKFVPRAFFQKKQIESMTGVYFPYWLYDANLEGSIEADARDIHVWRSGNTEYTQTKHYEVEREGEVELRDLPENALNKANGKLASGVLPYRFEKLRDFHMGYLSGFLAERRDIACETVQEKMRQTMNKSAEEMMRESITGYDSVIVRNAGFRRKEERWSYVLLPVWTITYKGRDGKIYYYSMNGQTGSVCGELPVDRARLALASGITAVVVLVLGLIGGLIL